MSDSRNTFWQLLDSSLQNKDFESEFIRESIRINTIDEIVNSLDSARETLGLSKGNLAKAIGAQSSSVRRLLTTPNQNPTLSTVIDLATAMGLTLKIEPLPAKQQAQLRAALPL